MLKYLTPTGFTLIMSSIIFTTRAQDSIDALVKTFMDNKEVPGLALIVANRSTRINKPTNCF